MGSGGGGAGGRYAKGADALAREVREQGYSCSCQDGHTFLVWRPGEARILARFNGHPKNESVLSAARRELRQLGILPGVGARKRNKEERMAATTNDQGRQTSELVPRLRAALSKLGGDTPQNRSALAERAVNVIAFRQENGMGDVEQFGSTGQGKSPPTDIARESLRGLLDRGIVATEKSLGRWSVVLEEIDRSNGRVSEPIAEAEPEPEAAKEPEAEEWSPELLALQKLKEDAEERAELAEQVVADVEKERDEARERFKEAERRLVAVQEEQNRSDLEGVQREQALKEAREEVERLKAEAGTPDEQVLALRGQLNGLRGAHGRAQKAAARKLAEKDARIEELETRLGTVAAELEDLVNEATEQMLVQYKAEHEKREIELLSRAEDAEHQVAGLEAALESNSLQWQYGQALLEELSKANGAPAEWILTRLDGLAGLAPGE